VYDLQDRTLVLSRHDGWRNLQVIVDSTAKCARFLSIFSNAIRLGGTPCRLGIPFRQIEGRSAKS
jgi:hypothetical protein